MPRPNPFCVHCGLPTTPSMLQGNTTVEPSFAVTAVGVLRNLACAAVAASAESRKSRAPTNMADVIEAIASDAGYLIVCLKVKW